MHRAREIDIPNFAEPPYPKPYSPTGIAARASFLQNVAIAWQQAGDAGTAAKMKRDADTQVERVADPAG